MRAEQVASGEPCADSCGELWERAKDRIRRDKSVCLAANGLLRDLSAVTLRTTNGELTAPAPKHFFYLCNYYYYYTVILFSLYLRKDTQWPIRRERERSTVGEKRREGWINQPPIKQ